MEWPKSDASTIGRQRLSRPTPPIAFSNTPCSSATSIRSTSSEFTQSTSSSDTQLTAATSVRTKSAGTPSCVSFRDARSTIMRSKLSTGQAAQSQPTTTEQSHRNGVPEGNPSLRHPHVYRIADISAVASVPGRTPRSDGPARSKYTTPPPQTAVSREHGNRGPSAPMTVLVKTQSQPGTNNRKHKTKTVHFSILKQYNGDGLESPAKAGTTLTPSGKLKPAIKKSPLRMPLRMPSSDSPTPSSSTASRTSKCIREAKTEEHHWSVRMDPAIVRDTIEAQAPEGSPGHTSFNVAPSSTIAAMPQWATAPHVASRSSVSTRVAHTGQAPDAFHDHATSTAHVGKVHAPQQPQQGRKGRPSQMGVSLWTSPIRYRASPMAVPHLRPPYASRYLPPHAPIYLPSFGFHYPPLHYVYTHPMYAYTPRVAKHASGPATVSANKCLTDQVLMKMKTHPILAYALKMSDSPCQVNALTYPCLHTLCPQQQSHRR